MIAIKFGRWDSAHLENYVYERIYIKGYKWTPFCWRTKRRNWRHVAPWTAHWGGW